MRAAELRLSGVAALVFGISAVATVAWCGSMASMPGMSMPGGWTMSMTWMRMPGQTWPGAGATFLGMWTLMMIAMMSPAVTPALLTQRRAMRSRAGADRLTVIIALGYFLVWMAIGAISYLLGLALAAAEMASPSISRIAPYATAAIVVVAGTMQLTSWKARQLACCRPEPDCCVRAAKTSRVALRRGIVLGFRCGRCCLPQTAMLLALGVMDLTVMALVTLAICAERIPAAGEKFAKVTGALTLTVGVMLGIGALQG